MRHIAVAGLVVVEVGIHQVERDTAHIDAPDAGVQLAARQRNADGFPVALFVLKWKDRQLGEALRRVKVDLVA